MDHRTSHPNARSGVATVELALVLPFLVFLFVITIDFGRVFYFSLTLTNCARDGALYASDPVTQQHSTYSVYDAGGTLNLTQSVVDAASAEAPSFLRDKLKEPGNVTVSISGDSVSVSVKYQFNTVSKFPGIPDSVTLTRTVTMRYAPDRPS